MMESSELVFLILHAVACLSLTPVSSWQAHQNSSLLIGFCMYALFLLVRISRRISMNYPSTAGCRTDHYDCVESIENLPIEADNISSVVGVVCPLSSLCCWQAPTQSCWPGPRWRWYILSHQSDTDLTLVFLKLRKSESIIWITLPVYNII